MDSVRLGDGTAWFENGALLIFEFLVEERVDVENAGGVEVPWPNAVPQQSFFAAHR